MSAADFLAGGGEEGPSLKITGETVEDFLSNNAPAQEVGADHRLPTLLMHCQPTASCPFHESLREKVCPGTVTIACFLLPRPCLPWPWLHANCKCANLSSNLYCCVPCRVPCAREGKPESCFACTASTKLVNSPTHPALTPLIYIHFNSLTETAHT